MNKTLKKKIFFDIRILIIFIPSFYFGWIKSPFYENNNTILPVISGACMGVAIILGAYLLVTWLFYDKFYNND